MATSQARHGIPSDDALEIVAARFRVLSDATRLRLLRELMDGELAVQDLVTRTDLPQPTVSKQLAVLRSAGIVGRRPQGTQVFYRLTDESVLQLCEIVCHGLERRLAGHLEALARPPGRRPARR